MLITLAEVKQYLRVTYDDDDALLEQLLTAAQELCMAVARLEDGEE
ncbi:MAG: phage gp6-like head-tail connector protein, partial [Oscillospiraceae bacterium]|nr:phage gp6-like head-tail connector protein [Oscillospiraceae bacterium]